GLVTAAERVEELRTHRVRRGAVGIERDGAFAGVERSVELASRAQDGGLELVEAGIGRVEIARAVERRERVVEPVEAEERAGPGEVRPRVRSVEREERVEVGEGRLPLFARRREHARHAEQRGIARRALEPALNEALRALELAARDRSLRSLH